MEYLDPHACMTVSTETAAPLMRRRMQSIAVLSTFSLFAILAGQTVRKKG